ncbi:MAG: MFS transporter, partial [Bacilli bacterium]
MAKINVESVQKTPFKLNYKRTFIIGFAFFGILMLWQIYNNYCPTILTELLTKQMHAQETDVQWIVGVIMAMDNVFAIFMLPLFGALSDKTHTKFGKRMPYIVIGTILASIALILIPVAFAFNSLLGVIIAMALVLVFMQMYRNPAVALMPDITPKPLRAKANGIINLVGYLGAILAGVLALVITNKRYFVSESNPDYQNPMMYIPFIVASVLMIGTMLLLFFTINENKILKEMEPELKRGEALAEVDEPLQ